MVTGAAVRRAWFRMSCWLWFPALAITAPRSLASQEVRGRLIMPTSGGEAIGALVVLQDSAGTSVAQAMSRDGGRFVLRAPHAGTYLLRVLRIGYPPWSGPMPLADGEAVDRTIALPGVPITLPEITVAGTSTCGARARDDSLASALWSQARTALALTNQTVRSRQYRFESVLEERDIDRSGTSSTARHPPEVAISGWPVQSPSPDTLLASGFVENLEDLTWGGGPTWYGPDPEFLLSEAFFAGHCFRALPPGAGISSEWVGLGFDPAVEDHRADIRGTLWLDRETAELRRLDFAYTRLPKWARGTAAGGSLQFAPLPGGGWIVQRWSVRVPVPERAPGAGSASLSGYRESGGRVVSVLSSSGELIQRYAF